MPPATIPTFRLDQTALHRQLKRQAALAQPPWLHREVAGRMADRLGLVLRKPARWLDWWSFLGAGSDLLRNAYPRAEGTLVEPDEAMHDRSLRRIGSPRWWNAAHWRAPQTRVCLESALSSGAAQVEPVDLIWSNMVLHHANDPTATFRAWHGLLAEGGFAMFSTVGPDTLLELRKLYALAGWPAPHVPFVDMHDLGDMLVGCGFAEPVVDQELLTLSWSGPEALLAELRELGGHLSPERFPGLRTPRWRLDLLERLRGLADEKGRISLRFELIYGHAFKPTPRTARHGPATISLDRLHSGAGQSRKPGF
jgi:malonyl-CoA O-methyltransferase